MEGKSALLTCSFSILIVSTAVDIITTTQSIKDGETIVSAGGRFELGFFSPGNSNNRYVGIWYNQIPIFTVVWVANREVPLDDSSGILNVTREGILVLLNRTDSIIWSSNSSRTAKNPVAQLLDSGNLVVKDASDDDDNPKNFLWQSFDYPSDTFLPGMEIGRVTATGLDRYVSSWKSMDDPARGDFTYRIDPRGYPQYFLRRDLVEQFRSGPWNGLRFSGMPNLYSNPIYNFTFVLNQREMYFTYELLNSSVLSRMTLNPNGVLQRLTWMDGAAGWTTPYLSVQMANCDMYALCGAYSICTVDKTPECGCLKGFVPSSPIDWGMADWKSGCVRRKPLDCQNGDRFLKYSGVKLPDTRISRFNESITLEECKLQCLKDCSCMAYSSLDISGGGSGCFLWLGPLIDIREFTENGQDLYVRMAASELGQAGSIWEKGKWIIIGSVVSTGTIGVTSYVWKKKRQQKREGRMAHHSKQGYHNEDLQLPSIDFTTIVNATNNFSINNKLGQGGFGPVYKGTLEEGQGIAVKRLSKNSRQGVDEFKNEVIFIAKLQHRNLVKLLGYCIQGEEKMLIYEYMPNNSLDSFIFDESRSSLLDWSKRFHIINGIARGLLYLHQDSRLRIIHRDLKASNILLDYEMNAKISDFGLARSFGGGETEANTERVVGTYGYMSPEYAIDGLFSIKSDVFSFGVLVLEIVSGKRNKGFCHPDHHLNLLGHAWRLYKEGKSMELIGASMRNSCSQPELLRTIHVGLLCVQQCPEDRPDMSTVILMLGGEGTLPQSKQPGFFTERNLLEANSLASKHESCSANMVTITQLEGR